MHLPDITKLQAVRIAWIAWIIFFAVIAVIVGSPSNRRTVMYVYRDASINWFKGANIYEKGPHGFLYLPQSCILTSPLELPPFKAAEVIWRAFTIGILSFAVWKLARLGGRGRGAELFPLMTLLVIPTAMDSARNGQMNNPMVAMMSLAAVDLAERRWSLAAFWLLMGFALKPLVAVMLGFAALLYRPLRWRLFLGMLLLFALPFLTQNTDYVLTQYELFFAKMQFVGEPQNALTTDSHSEIFSIARSIGYFIPPPIQHAIRVLAAGVILGLSWLGLRRWGHERGTLLFFSFTACFVLLFNPRTENCSYVLAGVPMALFASWAFLYEGRRVTGALIAAASVIMAATYEITRGYNDWISPSVCLGFLLYLIWLLLATGDRTGVSKDDGLIPGL